eukprot:7310552-Pyramimonas_sp.AAC.1
MPSAFEFRRIQDVHETGRKRFCRQEQCASPFPPIVPVQPGYLLVTINISITNGRVQKSYGNGKYIRKPSLLHSVEQFNTMSNETAQVDMHNGETDIWDWRLKLG